MTDPTPLDLGAAAARLAGDWQVDEVVEFEIEAEASGGRQSAVEAQHEPEKQQPAYAGRSPGSESPPTVEQLAEALLFVGGPPLTATAFAAAVRVPPEAFEAAVAAVAAKYRRHRRPYAVVARGGGYVLALLPAFAGLRAKLYGGPREARLTPPAVDTLSLVAYRQPVAKADLDAARGADCGPPLRQLVRVGLVAVARRGDGAVCYGTTPRFLNVMGLATLDDLPRIGPAEAV